MGEGGGEGERWGEPVVQVGVMPADTKEVPGHLQVLSLEAGPLPPSRFTPHPHPHPEFSLSPRTASLFGFSKGGVSSPRRSPSCLRGTVKERVTCIPGP